MKNIPFIKPVFPKTDELREDMEIIIKNNFYTNSGPFEKKLAAEMSKFIGNNVSISVVNNATTALILAIQSIIKRDPIKNEIIIQSFTFAAGAEAILWCGFEPVFIDIEPSTWQADIKQASEYIDKNNNNVAGILLCNTFGVGNNNILEWEKLAKNHNLPLIIDSAAGLGALYNKGEILGSRGDCEVFSMHATKPFAVGEGGLVSSKNYELIDTVNMLKNFGFNSQREVDRLGLNGKAPEITSAIALRQLGSYLNRLKNRRRLLKLYKKFLYGPEIKFQDNDELSTAPFVSIKVDKRRIDSLLNSFKKAKIDVRNYYNPPLHSQALFTKFKHMNMYNTNDLCSSIISLPLHDDFKEEDIKLICKIVLQ